MRNIRSTPGMTLAFAIVLFGCGPGGNEASGLSPDAGNPPVVAWTRSSAAPPENWTSVASSADGTKLVAVANDGFIGGYIFTSVDSGATWTQTGSQRFWNSVASSADGTKLAAVASVARAGDYIYTSVDSGGTWTQTGTQQGWISVASSADGATLVAAVTDGYIYTSTDSGATWAQTATQQHWMSVASSADGTKLIAAGYGDYTPPITGPSTYTGDYIYTSVDSGATWTQTGSPRLWQSVASSADGAKLVATVGTYYWSPDYVYTSGDSGATWTQRDVKLAWWSSVASSADGTKLVAAVVGGRVYTSGDSGESWTPAGSTQGWSSVASSADGTKLVAVANNQDLYGCVYTATVSSP